MVELPVVQPQVEQPEFEVRYEPQAGSYTSMLTVDGDVTFHEAPRLRKHLFAAIEAHPERNLVVELSRVDRFDTAAMAVLLEGLLAARETGPVIYLVGASEPVTKVFRLAGFEEALLRCYGCMDDVHQHLES